MSHEHIQQTVEAFNIFVSSLPWCDFDVLELVNDTLIIRGALSQSYPPDVELVFERTFAVSLPLSWRTNTCKPVLRLLSDAESAEFNRKLQVTTGNYAFGFCPEGHPSDADCIVAAASFRYTILRTEPHRVG